MADRPGRGRIYSRGFSRSVLPHPHSGARIADAGFAENILRRCRLVCFSRTLLLLAAADETGDLPAARILAVANLVGDQRADAAGGDVTDLAAGRDHAQPLGAGALDRVPRRLVDGHAHEDEPEF